MVTASGSWPHVDDEVAAGVGGGQREETGAHARVELGGLRLQAVRGLGEPLAGGLGGDVQQNRQMRYEPVRRPARDPRDLGRGEVAARTLVGHGRVDVPVGDDHRAALQGGPHDGVDVLRAVRGVQQRLRAVRQTGAGDVEQDRPQPLAHGRGTRLAGEDDLVALGPDPVGERLGLGGLPGAVAALQGDEEAGRHGRLLRVVAAEQRVPQVVAQGNAGTVVDLGEHQRGHRQQQRADQHQRERGAAVGEDELAVLQAVRPDERSHQRGDQGAERHQDPYDRVQVLRDACAALVLGLLVE